MVGRPGDYAKRKDDPAFLAYERDRKKAWRYGISIAQLRELRARGMVCNICDTALTPETECVDHCHESEYVRGLLCNLCNLKLGWYERHEAKIKAHLRRT